MDEGNSRRSLSPYHEKCFPPYCDNAQQVDKAMVSKMPRGDLEDKYIIFADENLELKKQNRNQERQIQRLQTAIQRQDKLDKRSGLTPTSRVADSNQVAILEAQNKNLQAKVKVLKQQLMNHSFIHSKESRINDAKMRQGQAKTPRDSEYQIPSQSQSAREAKPDKNVGALKMRIADLEDQLETQKNKYKARIAQLEKELSALEKEAGKSGTSVNEQLSETSRQVKDNKELIKLRMQAEKQAAELEELQDKLKAAEDEVDKLRGELQDAKDQTDDLEKQLERERNKSRTAVSEASKGTTHMETIRALEEQIRDLQKERDTLKDTNEKLLQLTQSKSEKSVKVPSGHSLQISQLENTLKEKMEELEEKEAKIRELEEQLTDAKKVDRPVTPSQSTCPSKKECDNCQDLSKQLCNALMDNAKIKSMLEAAQKPKTPTPTPKGSETELNRLRDEVESLRDEADRLKNEVRKLEDQVEENEDKIKSLRNELVDLENKLSDASDELNTLRPIAAEHENCRKTPLPSTSSKDDALIKQNQRLEDELKKAWQELGDLRPIVEDHTRNCKKTVTPHTSTKSIQASSHVSFKVGEEPATVPSRVVSEESVHSKKTIDSERYIALHRQLQEALWENEKLKRELESRDGVQDDALRRQNQRLEDELNRALQELREVRPIADEHNRNCGQPRKEYIVPEQTRAYVGEYLVPEYPKQLSEHYSKERQPSPVPSYSSRAPPRQEYVSHVTPPPSIHCVETVDVKDTAQRANLVIVSRHDFETVLMQKKRYSTEVEVVEPVDGRQTLNCKLEICMFDLDIDDRMMEYLSSIQPEPKVYVEWSFVGLDQRTAPLPAEQALFYTNVMYCGPLSSEIKSYLNKVEMPIDLYLVRSSGPPLKVAEGHLDMLPAMEQPNRGFMRSVFLRGKDLPSRYATDKAVATIHCSFILHECCYGDPPFRDQLEVAIGTLYLKNRDGGIVPDHATHIYIEYALLGHCGPDLETDSVPRGEVMKFNHTKKLRVNEENAPHLKAMLSDDNPRPLRFTILAEPCSLTSDTEVETVGHADINLNEEMIRKDRDLVSLQVPVYSNEGEHLGALSVTVLGIGTLQEVYYDRLQAAR